MPRSKDSWLCCRGGGVDDELQLDENEAFMNLATDENKFSYRDD